MGGHPVQHVADADGQVLGPVDPGLLQGRGPVGPGQAAGDDRTVVARHRFGDGPEDLGDQLAQLLVTTGGPDHGPIVGRDGPGRVSLRVSRRSGVGFDGEGVAVRVLEPGDAGHRWPGR